MKIHIKEQPRVFERWGVQWTPTILMLDAQGKEHHRIEGYLPAEDFLAQLEVGLGHTAFAGQRWAEAEKRFREVLEKLPTSDAAAEAMYWAGVAKYKGSGDPSALRETAQQFKQKYSDTAWAKKASVWGG